MDAAVCQVDAAAFSPPAPRVSVPLLALPAPTSAPVFRLRDRLAQAGDDAAALWRMAADSVRLEESVATGCLLVQAVALVRLWTRQRGVQAVAREQEAEAHHWRPYRGSTQSATAVKVPRARSLTPFCVRCAVCQWWRGAMTEGAAVSLAANKSPAAVPISPAPRAVPVPRERYIRWRAAFALKL